MNRVEPDGLRISIHLEPSDKSRQQGKIRGLFSSIAPHYDLLNRLMSLGMDQRWRRAALKCLKLPAGGRLLDIATGTGDVALMAKQIYPHSSVVGMDMTFKMLRIAIGKDKEQGVKWGSGDALNLPFADESFEGVISAFMMRNVGDTQTAMGEQARVVRSGGKVVCLEMTWPKRFPMRWLFHIYFFGWVPAIGRILSGKGDAYHYLPASVKNFIAPDILAQQMAKAGLSNVRWERKMLGTVTLHVGEKAA